MINRQVVEFYREISSGEKSPGSEKLLAGNDNTELDARFIARYCHRETRLLDLGSGSGLIIKRLIERVGSIVAVEKFKEFAKHICTDPNVRVVIADLLDFKPRETYDMVTLFGVGHHFIRADITVVYENAYACLAKEGILIVKNQFGVKEDVNVNHFSEALGRKYYAQYRYLQKERELLKQIGFKQVITHDIYPPAQNKWENTHYYALVCHK